MTPTRASLLLAVSLLPSLAVSADKPFPLDVDVRPLADDVWVHTTKNPDGIPSNGLIVRSAGQVLLVDTAWTPEQTAKLLDWVEKNLGAKVTSAIVTHSHADRMGGLAELERRGIPAGGVDLTAARAQAAGTRVPKTLFASSSRKLEHAGAVAFYPGAGHTTDNIVVYVPSAKVLFGGCLVKAENAQDMGYVAEADLGHWPEAIRTVKERFHAAVHVVPGHGPVGGQAALQRTLDLIDAHVKKAAPPEK